MLVYNLSKFMLSPLGGVFLPVRILTRPGQTRPDQARPGQARPDQARPGQTRQGKARPDQARPGQARPGQTEKKQYTRKCRKPTDLAPGGASASSGCSAPLRSAGRCQSCTSALLTRTGRQTTSGNAARYSPVLNVTRVHSHPANTFPTGCQDTVTPQ